MANGYSRQIQERIRNAAEGTVFVSSDFADIADTETIRRNLNRLTQAGVIRRILKGIYEKPEYSEMLKEYVAADPDAVAKALARSYHWTIAPCGNTALNLLGLSTQVTAVWSYISDGPYKTYEWNSTRLEFKHRTNKEITGLSYMTILVIQALKTLGKSNVTSKTIQALQSRLSEGDKAANARAEVFLAETFCPAIKDGLSQELGREANVYIDEKDKQTVIFAYPNLFTNSATLQVIRLEIGALAAWTPAKQAVIEPYASEYYPAVFEQKDTSILTVAPERTFWEKATILHHEANRPEHLEMPQRYSRHYYDLYRMATTPVKEAAFSRLDLLKKVVDFKIKFYPRAWAKYSEAVPGTLKLIPPEYRFAALEADYDSMKDMLYGDVPTFGAVIDAVRELEKEINTL